MYRYFPCLFQLLCQLLSNLGSTKDVQATKDQAHRSASHLDGAGRKILQLLNCIAVGAGKPATFAARRVCVDEGALVDAGVVSPQQRGACGFCTGDNFRVTGLKPMRIQAAVASQF